MISVVFADYWPLGDAAVGSTERVRHAETARRIKPAVTAKVFKLVRNCRR